MQRGKRRSLFTDRRGAATTEGLIVSVFLIACFALTLFVFKRYAVALRTSAATRQALWARVFEGTDEGDLDTRLSGAYPRYESRVQRLVPVLEPYLDEPRIDWDAERREDRFVSSPYMGSREVRYRTSLGSVVNETPDNVEEELPNAVPDTWCRVSPVCDPSGVVGIGGGAP